ncbi:phage tail tape measure protein [Pseudomonas sp. URMO17WK12:I11]|uniref:phage tail tape measure protein n=1 Tax=Pseudomonas sp. URMO17WK12:I11 TaxID=1283291 RepID=UPI0011A8C49F
MAKMKLALEIGGSVAGSVGAAFKDVQGRIQKLEQTSNKAKVLKGTIGDTIKLQAEWKRAHDTGAAGADKLLRKLNGNLESLRKQGVEVGRLSREYQRLARDAKSADLQLKGHQQINAGKSSLKTNVGAAAAGVGLTAIPTKISADYQAIIRDIAIKADAVNKPEEVQLSRTVIQTAKDTGMGRNEVADLINQLVGAGMELDKAMAYAPTAAKFAIGQGASGVDTASMIMALQQNAKITDPKVMEQALEAIAYQGQAGSFEASDMAKWFPQLLAGMENNGITGMASVSSLGAMLQVQMKTAGSSDEAANNFKNWMEKIGSGDVVKAYKDVGIDYQASLNTGLQKGMNVIESSMALAMKYVEATDPAKAKKMKDAQANIDKEVDPEKAKAALEALEKTLRTGDLFADMQVKAALTAYAQNRGLYSQLKADSQNATGILDKNLAERRETSSQRWAELGQAWSDSMRSVGDAIRPATDAVAQGLTAIVQAMTTLSDKFPAVIMGLAGLAAAVSAVLTARGGVKILRGAYNVARGRSTRTRRGGKEIDAPGGLPVPKTGNPLVDAGLDALGQGLGVPASNDPLGGLGSEPQRVFVVNADAFGRLGGSVAEAGPREAGSRRARRRRRAGALADTRRTPSAQPRVAANSTPHAPPPAAKVPGVNLPPTLPMPTLVGASSIAGEVGSVARAVHSVRSVTKTLSKVPGGKLMDVVPGVLDVAMNAETRDEKAEGYGGLTGGVAGAWAGGAYGATVGAAVGSVVPVLGTAIGGAVGGAIGMVLGGLGGESVGGWLGKKLFGDYPQQQVAEQKSQAKEAPKAEAPMLGTAVAKAPAEKIAEDKPQAKDVPKVEAPFLGAAVAKASSAPAAEKVVEEGQPRTAPGAVVRALVKESPPPVPAQTAPIAAKPAEKTKAEPAKVDQSFAIALTMPVTVQGDVKDPYQLVRDMDAPLRALFQSLQRELAARQASIQLFDAAHII